MALDGIAIAHLVCELRGELVGGRIDKIYQPERDEAILHIKKGQSRRLLLCAGALAPRAHITETVKENPKDAPLFCMVLRKHLLGGRIADISQGAGFERVINFDVTAVNEMGEMCGRRLVIEIMGKHSNIILLNEEGLILGAIKRVTREVSSVREILPGLKYTLPPAQGKADSAAILRSFASFAVEISNSDESVGKTIFGRFSGISTGTAKEIVHRAELSYEMPAKSLDDTEKSRLFAVFTRIVEDALAGRTRPELLTNGKGAAVGFAPYEMTLHPKDLRKKFNTLSALLEEFCAAKDAVNRIGQKSRDLRQFISANIERCVRKYDTFRRTLNEIEGRDEVKLMGELLTANLYQVRPGMDSITLPNYHDEGGGSVTIPLDTRLTPTQNAQNYYKRYNKEKRAYAALGVQMEQNDRELAYLESVMDSLTKADGLAELNEIREELAETGYARRRSVSPQKKRKETQSTPLSFTSSDGFAILVGKNNRQNDEITMKNAESSDIWLHAKDIPGSHVVIKAEGRAVPAKTIEEAASLAAFYSKAAASALVPVDYTLKKHVKKPSGAKPGMVIYTHQKTAFVKPEKPAREDK